MARKGTHAYTEADLLALLASRQDTRLTLPVPSIAVPRTERTQHEIQADPYRSKTERRFAMERLAIWQDVGRIQAWRYEPVRLWLRPQMSYTPDFLVQREPTPQPCLFTHGMTLSLTPDFVHTYLDRGQWNTGAFVFYEVKASLIYEPRRALDRLKMAAHLYPMFHFTLAQWDSKRQEWYEKVITAS
jgi:hypothetical protein